MRYNPLNQGVLLMKADAMKLLDFIGKSQEKQFVIPIYQRVYSWEKEQCK